MLSGLAVLGGILVITRRNAVHSALALILTLLSVAGLYLMLYAPFGAGVQIILYAGGIMVLFLFVVMLVSPRTSTSTEKVFQHQWDIALVLFPVFLLPFLYILWTEKFPDVPQNPDAFRTIGTHAVGNTEAVSWILFRDYLVPFEVASVFLLVAMIGAVVLGKRSLEKMD